MHFSFLSPLTHSPISQVFHFCLLVREPLKWHLGLCMITWKSTHLYHLFEVFIFMKKIHKVCINKGFKWLFFYLQRHFDFFSCFFVFGKNVSTFKS